VNEPILEVRGLSASYDAQGTRIPAVRAVDLDLHRGETLALVGESAAGKTSVAMAILGLLADTATVEGGDVRFAGEPILGAELSRLQRIRGAEIAVIFQDAQSALTPTIPIGEQLGEVYTAHLGLTKRDARTRAVERLREVIPDAERVAGAFPFQLSGGMAQRVMIAMATALEPKVIIADEPTASLDAAVRHETLTALEQLRDDRGVSVLLITHDFGVVARLADRVAVMYAGEIVEQADVRTIYRAPKHPYTFGLLSSLPAFAERDQLMPMRGQPPDLSTLPAECPFLPRCNKAISQCRTEDAPSLEATAEGHLVACYNPMATSLRND
jgi:oligopeptide/dipeptide ABC transporter ATP-binding protein